MPNLGFWRVVPPSGLTSTGTIHKFQEQTVARLATLARQETEEVNVGLQGLIEDTYTEGEGTLLATTQAKVSASRDGVEVAITTGANHVVFLTSLAGLPVVSPGHLIPREPGRVSFYWKSPYGGDPAGVYSFRQVFWRPHNYPAGEDPIGTYLTNFADRFARDMLDEHQRAVVQFVSENESYSSTAGSIGYPKRVVGG